MQKSISTINSLKFKLLIFNLIIVLFPLLIDKETLVMNLYIFFVAQIIAFGLEIYNLSKKEKISLYSLLAPSFICVFYISVSFAAGSYTSSRGIGLTELYLYLPQKMLFINSISFFILLMNFLVFQLYKRNAKKKHIASSPAINIEKNRKDILKIFFLIFLHLIFFNIAIDWNRIGITSNFNYPFLFTTSVILFFIIAEKKPLTKYFIYGIILLLYIKFNFDSKREIIYILMLIIFFELVYNPKVRLNLRLIVIFISTGIIAIGIIIVSSVYRGYGSYDVSGFLETVYAASNYIGSDIFKDAFVENFELNTSFCNAFYSIELVLRQKIEYQYGFSFLRIFLFPFPTSTIPWKPDRIIDIYTSTFSPDFFSGGGSLPTTFYSEAFMNFHFFSVIFIAFIFYIADKIFYFASKNIMDRKLNTIVVLSIFSSITAMQFIRGSSIDLYIIYVLFALPFVITVLWLLKLKIIIPPK